MAKKVNTGNQENSELKAIEGALSSSEAFIEKNQKTLIIVLCSIIVIIGAWLLFQNLYLTPNEEAAEKEMALGQQYFAAQQYELALNGDSVDFSGFVALNDDYSLTKSGKLAGAYAGLIYYKLGEYDKAIEYLSDYSGSDDVLNYTVQGTIGDCYVQKGEAEKAIKYFSKAAESDNILVSPVYMVKAGLVYESLGQYDKAIELYEEVKSNFTSKQKGIPEVDDIDKYIIAATAKNGK